MVNISAAVPTVLVLKKKNKDCKNQMYNINLITYPIPDSLVVRNV